MQYLIIIISYLFLLASSGYLVEFILSRISHKKLEELAEQGENEEEKKKKTIFNTGNIIGKCENVLILTFMLLDAHTALALVITAKTLIRKEEIEKNSIYFLAGTMVNVSYSVLIGYIVKLILNNLMH